MALKDMKSDLSKFRMPKKTPLESKDRVKIDKTQNQTPLSSMVESAPKIPRSQTTTNKEGVNPQKVNQSEKFKGETSPQPMDNSEKFKGETSPQPMSLEERFLGQTEPTKLDNSEKFLGETSPQPMDNSEKFLGETTPKSKDNTGQFLGETNPKPMSLEERYLGETTPTDKDSTGQFLGETNPNIVQQGDKFKGETTTESVSQGDKFKGETDPTKFNNTSNFVRFSNEKISSPFSTEPDRMNLDAKFLGETTPNPSDASSKFLGETTPNPSDASSKFLGETTPTEMDEQTGDKFLGETTPNVTSLGDKFKGETTTSPISQGDKNKGETTPSDFTFNGKLENEGKDFKEVNYFSDIHARGFTSKFQPKDPSKFIGVSPDQTSFNTATSLYGNFSDSFDGLSFTPGYGKFKLSKETGNTQRYNFESKYYVDTQLTNPSISKLHEMRSSPSFLDEMYDKFNLRDDAFNLGTAAFAHPLILRGIQRKGLDKGEPQKWGFGFPIDDGLVRGGIVTAVDRAVVDAVRLGKWMISVQGLLWGIKNLGLQASNANVETTTGKRLTKVWTPINTIASSLGGFIGLHPRRHGILPLPEAANPEKYETVQKAKRAGHVDDITLGVPLTGNRLVGLYNESFFTVGGTTTSSTFKGTPFLRLQSPGGPNSLYGLIPGGRVPTRGEDTRYDIFDGFTIQNQYNVAGTDPSTGPTSAQNLNFLPFDRDKTPLGKEIKPYTEFNKYPDRKPSSDPNDTTNKKAGIIHNDEFTYEKNRSSDLQGSDYTGNDLGLIWESYTTEGRASDGALNRDATHTSKDTPFEKLKNTEGKTHPIEKNDTAGEVIKNYETIAYGNIPTREAGSPSINDFRSSLTSDEKKRADKSDYTNKHIHTRVGFANYGAGRDLTNHSDGLSADPITSAPVGFDQVNDLVNFWVQEYSKGVASQIQFRGTISGLTDTFSPSWDSVKFAGRADQGYKYGTFERSLSFNFQSYATSRDDMIPMWNKLERLSTMTMPEYGGGEGYQGTLVRFRVGDLYKGKLAFIESLTYTISDEVPWDINIDGKLGELPMGIDVAIGFKILDDQRPQYEQTGIYDWSF